MTEEDIARLVALHIDGDRQGPGSDAVTRRALDMTGLADVENLRIADIGCGTGASALILAGLRGARVDAVDFLPEFLDRLRDRAHAAGVAQQIVTHCADMGALPLADGAYDLLWSEGAIYNIGFANGVAAFRPLLKPGGILAVSELTWLTASRPDPLTMHWDSAYPEVDTASAKIAVLEAAGYTPIGYFPLPRDAWMDSYYSPLRNRFADFLTAQGNDPAALAVVEAEEAEIALYERYSEYVSYGFYIAKVQS